MLIPLPLSPANMFFISGHDAEKEASSPPAHKPFSISFYSLSASLLHRIDNANLTFAVDEINIKPFVDNPM